MQLIQTHWILVRFRWIWSHYYIKLIHIYRWIDRQCLHKRTHKHDDHINNNDIARMNLISINCYRIIDTYLILPSFHFVQIISAPITYNYMTICQLIAYFISRFFGLCILAYDKTCGGHEKLIILFCFCLFR